MAKVSIILNLILEKVEARIVKKELMAIRSGTDGHPFRARSEDLETHTRRRSRVITE